jgi:hypothetical protein
VNNELAGIKSAEERTFGSSPSTDLSSQFDTDDLGTFELPWNISHDINSISTTNTTSDHSQATSVWSVRIRTDHKTTRERIVLENYLMNNTRAGFPESHVVLLE